MPFRITTKTFCSLPEEGERLIQRKKNSKTSKASFPLHKLLAAIRIGGFHAISGDTNNNGEMNKRWCTNKAS